MIHATLDTPRLHMMMALLVHGRIAAAACALPVYVKSFVLLHVQGDIMPLTEVCDTTSQQLEGTWHAMQGAFTGDLSLSTSNQCILPVAYISAGPPTLSNASSATFVFNSTQGAVHSFSMLRVKLPWSSSDCQRSLG